MLTGLVSEFGKQGQAVQQLINQTQAITRVNTVEQSPSSHSANHNVQDLHHSAGADRDACVSARDYPEHIDTYLNTEIKHNAIKGPYKDPSYEKHTHVCPLSCLEKRQRVIIGESS